MIVACGFISCVWFHRGGDLQGESFSHLLFKLYITLKVFIIIKDKFITSQNIEKQYLSAPKHVCTNFKLL